MTDIGGAAFPAGRQRRLRRTPALRRLVADVRLDPAGLVLPLFVKEGISAPNPIGSMPGVVQHTRDSVRKAAHEAAAAGVGGLILFGIPATKDARGSGADDPDGIVQLALGDVLSEVGDTTVVMTDLCLDEYTDHGHCGLLTDDGEVDNDATLERYASAALAQARAGSQVVAPSGMMDGQVAAIRSALDGAGFSGTPILAYSAKYASAFYGPFREAAECAPQFGDRSSYQQDPARATSEGVREALLDIAEGADAVMVKPAMSYLDVVRAVAEAVDVPVAAYQVSGEYAMVEAAAAHGWIDRRRIILETLTGIRRAGAGMVLTYWATEAAGWLREA
ncbi:MAG: Porphobilinogen synthase [Frankiales bacterium]|nr:Porphobilinogen synthase [Frankiales bacterium]